MLALYLEGHSVSGETREKIRIGRVNYLSSGKQKFKDTNIEKLFEKVLIGHTINYKKQIGLLGITVVDFLILPNIVVYCDGDYWHRNTGDRDNKQTMTLKDKGFKVYRFGGKEIEASAESCFARIEI